MILFGILSSSSVRLNRHFDYCMLFFPRIILCKFAIKVHDIYAWECDKEDKLVKVDTWLFAGPWT